MSTLSQHTLPQTIVPYETAARVYAPKAPIPQAPSAPQSAPTAAGHEPDPARRRTASQRPLLLLFTNRTNGQARRVEGFVAHALQHRGNHDAFRVRLIDQGTRYDLFERFSVKEVPTVLVVDDLHVVRRLSGNVRPHDLERELADWLR